MVRNGRDGQCARACPTEQVRKVRRAGESDAKRRFEQAVVSTPRLSWLPNQAADVIPLSGWDSVESGCLAVL